ncbi:hypothetical protein [uncultured Megasphaera sp.]|uniref:hypothetical protein n=1 Tax=uncultured Megasphaera sp. TaxID=165188 RepID=UPI002061CFD0|nr:hypothetical protein [uncultured Megasphaera sp.]DAQ39067.1 MAG TPA: hypothetical protein [Caudoviricetes sp.]
MYKCLKEYLKAFGKDFPISQVADYTEYEVCRIIQYCVEINTEYGAGVVDKALAGEAKVGTATIS